MELKKMERKKKKEPYQRIRLKQYGKRIWKIDRDLIEKEKHKRYKL